MGQNSCKIFVRVFSQILIGRWVGNNEIYRFNLNYSADVVKYISRENSILNVCILQNIQLRVTAALIVYQITRNISVLKESFLWIRLIFLNILNVIDGQFPSFFHNNDLKLDKSHLSTPKYNLKIVTNASGSYKAHYFSSFTFLQHKLSLSNTCRALRILQNFLKLT